MVHPGEAFTHHGLTIALVALCGGWALALVHARLAAPATLTFGEFSENRKAHRHHTLCYLSLQDTACVGLYQPRALRAAATT